MQPSASEIRELIPARFDPTQTRDLEQFKDTGHKLQTEGGTVGDQAHGVLVELFCHFHKSRNAALSNRRKHPGFEEYAQHWLFANTSSEGAKGKSLLKCGVVRPKSLKIEPGQTYWLNKRR